MTLNKKKIPKGTKIEQKHFNFLYPVLFFLDGFGFLNGAS